MAIYSVHGGSDTMAMENERKLEASTPDQIMLICEILEEIEIEDATIDGICDVY